MTRHEIKHFVEEKINTGSTPIEAITQVLLKLQLTDIPDLILWYQQRISGE